MLLRGLLRTAGIVVAWAAWRSGSPAAVPLFIGSAVLSSFLSSIADPAWLSWLADLKDNRLDVSIEYRRLWQ